jgi:hypothetical protein
LLIKVVDKVTMPGCWTWSVLLQKSLEVTCFHWSANFKACSFDKRNPSILLIAYAIPSAELIPLYTDVGYPKIELVLFECSSKGNKEWYPCNVWGISLYLLSSRLSATVLSRTRLGGLPWLASARFSLSSDFWGLLTWRKIVSIDVLKILNAGGVASQRYCCTVVCMLVRGRSRARLEGGRLGNLGWVVSIKIHSPSSRGGCGGGMDKVLAVNRSMAWHRRYLGRDFHCRELTREGKFGSWSS